MNKSLILALAFVMAVSALHADKKSGSSGGGLRFTEIQSPGYPLVTFRIILRAGSVNDPKGKEGLNALTASMLANGGTKDLTYSQVMEKMYPWAAGVGANADQEITTFIGEVHLDNLDAFYKLFSDLLLNPRFDSTDFARIKDEQLNYLKNTLRATADEDLGKAALASSIYANHPYGKTDAGTVQGIASITLDDVKAYYRKMYTQGNLWIGLAGGYPSSLVETIKKDFGALPKGATKAIMLPKAAPIKDVEALIVEKPTRAYAVSMGYPIPLTRKDKDFYALMVANSYFGEHRTFNGVLMTRLRGARGLNYGDYSYIEKFAGGLGSNSVFPEPNTPLRQQCFSIWLRPVQPENTHFAIRNALYELHNLVSRGISKDDFESTRKFVINYSKLAVSTMSRRLGYKMDSEFYGTDYFIDRIEKELNKLTVNDVNKAIKKYLNDKNLKLAVVVDEGKGKEFLDGLTANTASPITYSAKPDQAILDQDKSIEVLPIKINAVKSKVVKASELFEN